MANKPSPAVEKKSADNHKGMMGDGTEEQDLNQPGAPGARIEQVACGFRKESAGLRHAFVKAAKPSSCAAACDTSADERVAIGGLLGDLVPQESKKNDDRNRDSQHPK
jgi:hypothetical protein